MARKINWQNRVQRHNKYSQVCTVGHNRPRNVSIDIVGDNIKNLVAILRVYCRENTLGILSTDRHYPPKYIVKRVHRWPLPVAICCASYSSIPWCIMWTPNDCSPLQSSFHWWPMLATIIYASYPQSCVWENNLKKHPPALNHQSVLLCSATSLVSTPFCSVTGVSGRQKWPLCTR